MHPILFHIGSWPVYTYGVMCALGLTVGYFIMAHWATQEGVDEDDYLNLFIILLVTSIGGARLAFVLTYPAYFADWTDAFRLWKGGLTIMGGGILTLAAFAVYCRWYRLKTGLILDLFVATFPVGIFFGRIGCFAFGCCYGAPTHLPWGVAFPTAQPCVPRHPTQLYTSAIMVVIFLVVLWYRNRPHVDGMVTVVFIYCYCAYRIPMELLRADTAQENAFAGLTNAQLWCLVILVLTALVHWRLLRLPPDRPSPKDVAA